MDLEIVNGRNLSKSQQAEIRAFIDSLPERMEAGSSPFSRNWTSLGPTRVSLRLDLSPSDAEIFAGFRKVTRYEIRRAEKLGLGIAASTSSQQDDQFLDLYFRVA